MAASLTSCALFMAWPLLAAAGETPAGDEPPPASTDDEEGENPWVDGPEAPPPAGLPPADAPREPAADVEPIDTAPVVPEQPLPSIDDGVAPLRPSPRLDTRIEQDELLRWGDLNLASALVMMPGLWWPYRQAASPLPSARGLPSEHLAVRLDGIPLLPSQAFADYPVLAHLPFDEIRAVTLRHGARIGLGTEGAAAGVLDIETLPPARDMGEEGAVTGRARGGYGGPDLEKAAFLRGETGLKRARISLAGGGFHKDNLALGRGVGILPNSYGLGGYLTGRVDLAPRPGVRVWALGHLSRQARTPLPSRCAEDADGAYTDCLFTQDRGMDLLGVGVDTSHGLSFVRVGTKSRFYVQRSSEDWRREGNTRTELEETVTELWRGGALVEGTLTFPTLHLLVGLTPEVAVGVEHLRDRVGSLFRSRSQRFSDGAVGFLEDPERAPLADGGLRNLTRGTARAGVYGDRVNVELKVEAAWHQITVLRPDLDRMEDRLVGRRVLTTGAELSGRLALLENVALFGALVRSERPDTLSELSRGRLLLVDDDPVLPALPGRGAFLDHTAELGGEVALPWLVVAGVLWAADRSGPLVVGQDPADLLAGDDGLRLLRSGRRQAGGFEGRARWLTPFNGLSAEGTLAAVAIDEGVFFRGDDPFGPKPARGVPRPTGATAIHWAPTDWPIHVWGRMRYALPQARLAPDEELDATLCPEGLLETQVQPCSGLFGYALYDFGMAFEPSRYLRLEAMAANLLDAPWQLRISDQPGGGLSARATATVSF